ncbi:MAG: hypothetical protein CMJ83_21520 [Planctomycetes bacterium]|nr:hypothetical protein [Planctomycetota bacterium]
MIHRSIAQFSGMAALVAAILASTASAFASPPQDPRPDPGTAKSVREALIRFVQRREPGVSTGPIRAQLDVYEIELAERLAGEKDARRKARLVAEYFFKQQRYTSHEDLAHPDNFYVDKMLITRRGYCLSLSAMILAVGARLKLPLHGVASPRHFFVRWDDGRVRVNIETTEGGAIRDDAYYVARGTPPEAVRAGLYLKNLTPRQVVAYLINNEGYVVWKRGDAAAVAERRFKQAIAVYPGLLEAQINLGVVAAERGDVATAERHFQKVLRWLPKDAATTFNRALAATRDGRCADALKLMEDARRGDPGNRLLRRYADALAAAVLAPSSWEPYQKSLVARSATLRKGSRLGRGLLGHYFGNPNLEGTAVIRVDRSVAFEWRYGRPHPRIREDRFSIRWTGHVDIPSNGPWTFFTVANDGVRLWVDGLRLIDNWKRNEGALDQATLPLRKGLHPIKLEYFDHTRFAGIELRIKRADGTRALSAGALRHIRP